MPTYEFICKVCGTKFSKHLHFYESTDKVTCPHGHTDVQRIFSPPSIVFKGSGWYKTDSRPKKESSPAAD